VASSPRLGARVRALRRREGLTQSQFAKRIEISASYLNLIENDRRPLTANVLIRIARHFDVDLERFSEEGEENLIRELVEVLGEPFFEEHSLMSTDIKRLAATTPEIGRALVRLYREHEKLHATATQLAARVSDASELPGVYNARLPTEEVNNLIQQRFNYFPTLEAGAERLWQDAQLDLDSLYVGLCKHLESALNVTVSVEPARTMQGMLRHYDPARRTLRLSERLPTGSRNFQLALQVGLLTMGDYLNEFAKDESLTTRDARVLCRVALSNYFAGAVLMPYDRFHTAAEEERYDIELIGNRCRASFEQVCHRLTTLRRPGAEGVPFHFIRIDIAGNISKRFSASGIRFARFGSGCAKWNVYSAMMIPGTIRRQISTTADGKTYFCIARTIRKGRGGYHAAHPLLAIGLGCDISHASRLVYADGIDFNAAAPIPIGTSCRTCERDGCAQRAFPSLHRPIRLSENLRGVSFFTTGEEPL